MAVLVSDSFNRANSTTTLGTTDSYNGGSPYTWQTFQSTWGILNNQAYIASIAAANGAFNYSAYIDVGASNVSITCTVPNAADVYVAFRLDPTGNAGNGTGLVYETANGKLQSFSKGAYTVIATFATATTGDVIKITANGSSITVYKNGTQIGTATSTINQTSTKHGMAGWRASGADGSTGLWDNFMIEDLNTGGTGTTYTGSGTTAGIGYTSDTNKLIAVATGTASGLSNVSTIASAILSAMGTAQGQSNVIANEIYVYSANGTAQGASNVTANELVIYLGGGTSSGNSSLTSNDTFTGVSGMTYSGSGTAVGGSNVSAVERMILAVSGSAQGASLLTTNELITLMASGIASGYSTVTVVDKSNGIIGRIELKGQRDLYVYLQGSRDMTVQLKGSRDLTINLKGSL